MLPSSRLAELPDGVALMQMSQMHYLPLRPAFFAILVGFFFIVLVLRSVRYAYESLGVSSNAAIFLLFATLIGSIFNIPIAELPPERVASDQVIDFFGMSQYRARLEFCAGSARRKGRGLRRNEVPLCADFVAVNGRMTYLFFLPSSSRRGGHCRLKAEPPFERYHTCHAIRRWRNVASGSSTTEAIEDIRPRASASP